MFNLEQSITEWRRQMAAGGIKDSTVLEELESHLRAEVEKQMQSGLDVPQALEAAVQCIGPAGALRLEFSKVGIKSWNRRLAVAAWAMFFVSFFLPSYLAMPGWACALLQGVFWPNALRGRGGVHPL